MIHACNIYMDMYCHVTRYVPVCHHHCHCHGYSALKNSCTLNPIVVIYIVHLELSGHVTVFGPIDICLITLYAHVVMHRGSVQVLIPDRACTYNSCT